jgi:hypothetical protein
MDIGILSPPTVLYLAGSSRLLESCQRRVVKEGSLPLTDSWLDHDRLPD